MKKEKGKGMRRKETGEGEKKERNHFP